MIVQLTKDHVQTILPKTLAVLFLFCTGAYATARTAPPSGAVVVRGSGTQGGGVQYFHGRNQFSTGRHFCANQEGREGREREIVGRENFDTGWTPYARW
jgi:hypothetical protein